MTLFFPRKQQRIEELVPDHEQGAFDLLQRVLEKQPAEQFTERSGIFSRVESQPHFGLAILKIDAQSRCTSEERCARNTCWFAH